MYPAATPVNEAVAIPLESAYSVKGRYTLENDRLTLDGRLFRGDKLKGKFEDALAAHRKGEKTIAPVMLRKTDWPDLPLASSKALWQLLAHQQISHA